MTDLPRFYEGQFGKLDFSHLNEMMKRLDLLLPVVQAAASGGGWTGKERSLVFPVYAERTGEPDSEGLYSYKWWEIVTNQNVMAWGGENIGEEGDTQLRAGLNGVLPFNPRDPNPNTDAFIDGFAIAFVIRSVSGGKRCILFPLVIPTDAGVGYIRIEGSPTTSTLLVGEFQRQVNDYPATFFQAEAGPDGEMSLAVKAEDIIAVDLNSSTPNEPSVTGSDTQLIPRPYDPGTMFQATRVADGRYAFTHLIRYDVVCS